MEEAAVGIAQFLTVLDLPLSIIGVVVGLITSIKRPGFGSPDLIKGTIPERIGVGLCAGVGFLGLLGLSMTTLRAGITGIPPLAILFAVSVLACGLPALLWKSPWRGWAEGLATIALSLAAFLSGFTIGYMFVPLLALMIWVCIDRILPRGAWLTRTSKLAILLGLR